MSCPDLQTGWEPHTNWPLSWNGSGWHYDGYYGGCDECGRVIVPSGSWKIGFRPTAITLTVNVVNEFSSGPYQPEIRFYLNAENGDYTLYGGAVLDPLKSSGTHTIEIDLTDEDAITGDLDDIRALSLWCGVYYFDDGYYDRPFTITDITFTPCPGGDEGCKPFWTNYILTRETNRG